MAKLNLVVHYLIKWGLNNGWHGFGNESSLLDKFVRLRLGGGNGMEWKGIKK